MKKSLFRLIITPVMITLVTFLAGCDESVHNQLKQKMKTIEIGMTKEQVIELLGEPPSISEGKVDSVSLISYVYPPPRGSAASIWPTVIICKETGLVVAVLIDESQEPYNKRAPSYELCKSGAEDSLKN